MNPDRWREIEHLFEQATTMPAGERSRLLSNPAHDAFVTAEVWKLLKAHDSTHPFLDAPAATSLPQGVRLGSYEVDGVLGSGGMATVYKAHRADRQFEKQVAIKVVTALQIAADDARFRRERKILASLEHPNIARLLDSGVNEFGQPFLVMELVEGKPLDAWSRDADREQRLDVWLQVASAVGYAHSNLVIHRDLKPSNILVRQDGEAKLLDFGIARLLSETSGATVTQAYTPLYASPEQIGGQPVSTATDIYSLGVILFELLTGRHPHWAEGRGAHDLADAIRREEPRMPNEVPADLAAIVLMALRKESARRYPTVNEFAEDVRRYQRGLPVVAQPETVAYRTRKFVGRHRLAVGSAVVVAVALIVLSTVATLQANRAQRELARAEKVTEFLSAIMGATPEGPSAGLRGKGVSLRVVDLVDQVAARVDRELGDQPEVEMPLRVAVGSVYNQMGLFEKAHTNSNRAVELAERLYAADDPRRLNALVVDALVNMYLGNWADVEREASTAERLWKNPPPYTVAGILSPLGLAQFRLGKTAAAEQTLLKALKSMEASLPPNDPWIGMVSTNLSNVYQERGEYEVAVRYLDRAAANARSSNASETLGLALLNLSVVQRYLGQPDATLRSAQEANVALTKALGESHSLTAQTLLMIGYAKSMLGESDAEGFARRGLAIEEAQLPPGHFERAVGLGYLGFILLKNGKLPEARQKLTESLEIRRKSFKAPNFRIADSAGWLGETMARQGDVAAARPLLEESYQTFLTLYGPANPRTLDAQARRDRWSQ